MTVVFFGSSSFSVPVLEALLGSHHQVLQVVTTPDKKKGRGQKLLPSVVKSFAEQHRVPTITPNKVKEEEVVKQIASLKPDFIVIASYGKIVPPSICACPSIAPLNVHPSLLSRHRGASPIQSAILSGDTQTGVSIAEITDKLDAGDVYGQVSTKIGARENAEELSDRLALLAAKLLLDVIGQFENNKTAKTPQDDAKSTYAEKIDKQMGKICWTNTAESIDRQARAYYPWPSTFAFLNGKRLKIIETNFEATKPNSALAGSIVDIDPASGIHVQTGRGTLTLKRVQLEGHREMGAHDFAMGQHLKKGQSFQV